MLYYSLIGIREHSTIYGNDSERVKVAEYVKVKS
jgi:hypothetical protein